MINLKEKIKKSIKENHCNSEMIKELEVNSLIKGKKIIRKKSAVLILIFPDKQAQLNTIIIKRAKDNSPHSGQIGLPGGRKELKDITLKKTAIREAQEELGINTEIEILGELNKIYIPVSNFIVQPFVGWLNEHPKININKNEINTFYIVPISDLIKVAENFTTKEIEVRGSRLLVSGIEYENIFIWGATAKILTDLTNRIKSLFE